MKSGWIETTIEQLCNVEYGTRVTRRLHAGTAYPVYGGGDETFRTDSFNREDCIVISRFGMSENCTRYVKGKFFLNDSGLSITPRDPTGLFPRYLDYLVFGLNDAIYSLGRGTAQKNLDVDAFRRLPCRFPRHVLEQKRIVATLDGAFERILTTVTNAERNLANSRELFEAFLNSAFTVKSERWTDTTVGHLVNCGILAKPLDGNHGEIHPKKAEFVRSGVPFIMASDLAQGLVNQDDCNFLSPKQASSLRTGFSMNGDVLLSHKGTIGRTAILHTSHKYVMLTPQVTYYRVMDKSKLLNRFIYYLFQTKAFQEQMSHYANEGSTRAYIGITKQLNLRIRFPPLNEQRESVASFDSLASSCRGLEANYRQKLDDLAELKKSILHRALNGELTAQTRQSVEVALA